MTRTITDDMDRFAGLIRNNQPVHISRFGDGEVLAMKMKFLTPANGEWDSGASFRTLHARKLLLESFRWKSPTYYVGIPCRCCQGSMFDECARFSGQDETQLTFSNIFVNANHRFFVSTLLPVFLNKQTQVVVNRRFSNVQVSSTIGRLIPVDDDAWLDVNNIWNIISDDIRHNHRTAVLISAGPLASIIVRRIGEVFPTVTALDVGSALSSLGNANLLVRDFTSSDSEYHGRVCVWNTPDRVRVDDWTKNPDIRFVRELLISKLRSVKHAAKGI
jgi:hypothetical protein